MAETRSESRSGGGRGKGAEARRTAHLVESLCAWFEREARDLPWRRRRSGYRALVAETMLQQTQVSRVVERYVEFLRRFPTVRRLAAASEQEVLAAWQGLGYYRRARNLLQAARRIVRDHGGRVPRDAAELRRLPGVGRYTAAAIASIVYGRAEPLVDGNVRRVLARLEARDGGSGSSGGPAASWAWDRAAALVAAAPRPGVLNEAVMELGALVCTPAAPRCPRCPVAAHCRALRQGRQEEIPAPRPPPRRRCEHHHAVVVVRGEKVLLERRGSEGMWSSMWQVPTVEAERPLAGREIVRALAAAVASLEPRGSFEHRTTHRWITFHVFVAAGRLRRGRWCDPAQLAAAPMSNAQRRVLARARGGPDTGA